MGIPPKPKVLILRPVLPRSLSFKDNTPLDTSADLSRKHQKQQTAIEHINLHAEYSVWADICNGIFFDGFFRFFSLHLPRHLGRCISLLFVMKE
jgi:hypothetical protein